MHNSVLIRYGEVSLKKGNTRIKFEKRLIRNARAALKDAGVNGKFKKEWGRIFYETEEPEKACEVISKIFGVVSCSPVWKVEFSTIDEIVDACMRYAEGRIEKGKSFTIRAKRAGNHPFTSQDVARSAGAEIVKKYGVKVDLKNPDVIIYNETRQKETYFYSDILPGPGGLPLGVEGKVVCLVSGGIDSPVAAWLMMKRGCAPIFVHADLRPFSSDESEERARKIIEILKSWSHGYRAKAYYVPHGKNLEAFMKQAPRKITCVLCKRAMLKIAERIAAKEKCLAIVTGESLGQVASQTLGNIYVIDRAIRLPVLRPLVGMDKDEIVKLAKRIGTFETSTQTTQYCTAFPEHPETSAELDVIEDEESFVGVEELVNGSVSRAVVE